MRIKRDKGHRPFPGGEEANGEVERERGERDEREEEQVLQHERLGGEDRCVGAEFLDARPG